MRRILDVPADFELARKRTFELKLRAVRLIYWTSRPLVGMHVRRYQ
ncbi:hypothetical protein [Mesorhizobium sp. B2-8-9]|nr:hypothetical protein [Mesorhizobium sp. B2-8-9]